MTPAEQLVDEQLVEELTAAAGRLADLGLHFADPYEPVADSQIRAAARMMGWQLLQDDDDRLAAQTVIDLLNSLWPHGAPEEVGQPQWWQTPVGRLCARSLGRDNAEALTHSAAAAILGTHRGTVASLVHRGHLDRHPDGGVTRASVLARLAR